MSKQSEESKRSSMILHDSEEYTLGKLVTLNAFKGISPTFVSYLNFIGRQSLRGNHLVSQFKETKMGRVRYRFTGKTVKEFIKRVK